MKKVVVCGVAASMFLTMVSFLGCGDDLTRETVIKAPTRIAPKVTIVQDKSAKDSELSSIEQAPEVELSCNADTDCVVIPTTGCLPCVDRSGQLASNLESAKEIMSPKGAKCGPEVKKLMESGKEPTRSQDPSCKYNGVKCVQGECQLANLSEAEMKAYHEGMKKRMPQGGQGPGAGGRESVQGVRARPQGYSQERSYPGQGGGQSYEAYNSIDQGPWGAAGGHSLGGIGAPRSFNQNGLPQGFDQFSAGPGGPGFGGLAPQGNNYQGFGGGFPPQGNNHQGFGGSYAPQGNNYQGFGGGYAPQGNSYQGFGGGFPPQGNSYQGFGGGFPPQGNNHQGLRKRPFGPGFSQGPGQFGDRSSPFNQQGWSAPQGYSPRGYSSSGLAGSGW